MTSPLDRTWVDEARRRIGHPVHYACLKGSRLFGTQTAGSDIDIVAVHQLPTSDILSLDRTEPSIHLKYEQDTDEGMVEVDLNSYELSRWLQLLGTSNGNFTESSCVPSGYFCADYIGEVLRALGKKTITKSLHPFYRGYAFGQLKRASNQIRTAKGIMYTIREALTGIYLLRTGEYIFDFYDLCARTQELLSWESRVLPRLTNTRAEVSLPFIDRAWEEFAYLETMLDDSWKASPLPYSYDLRDSANRLIILARQIQWSNPLMIAGIGERDDSR